MPENKHQPYKDRKEHDYVNEMTVVIAKGRLIIRDATQIMDRLQAIVEEHIETTKQKREEDS